MQVSGMFQHFLLLNFLHGCSKGGLRTGGGELNIVCMCGKFLTKPINCKTMPLYHLERIANRLVSSFLDKIRLDFDRILGF